MTVRMPQAAHVIKDAQFESKHHRGPHGRFAAGMSRPKLLKRDERAVAAIGESFQPHQVTSRGHAAEVTRAQPKRLTPDTVSAFHDLAKTLRRKGSDPRIDEIDREMHPTDRDLVLIRHMPATAFGLKDEDLHHLPEMLTGRKIVDRAYSPTALHQHEQAGGVTLHIAAPAGTRALVAGDNEIWLDRDLELAVNGVYPNGHGGYTVEVTALPKTEKAAAKKAAKAAKKTAAKTLPREPDAPTAVPTPTPAKKAARKAAKATAKKAVPAAKKAAAPAKKAAKKAAPALPPDPAYPSRGAARLDELMKNDSYDEVSAQVAKAMEGTFGGLNVQVTGVGPDDGKIGVEGIVLDPHGEVVGEFQRYFYHNEVDGKLVASHEFLQLAPHVQGSGFARAFNANLYDWYRRSGFDRVVVHANIDVGGYSWATQGFDFRNNNALEDWLKGAELRMTMLRNTMVTPDNKSLTDVFGLSRSEVVAELDKLSKLFSEIRSGRQVSAYEISQLGRKRGMGRDDMWVGKLIMLGSDWLGALRL